jgi:hypothetical protein
MAVVGLGAGTLAAYPDAGDSITFYEINPVVIKLTEDGQWFTYLRDCRSRGAHCEIHLGDARLSLKHELQSPASTLQLTQTLSGSPRRSEEGLGEGSPAEKSNTKPSYYVLALDAFSGDSVPAHLLTVEAFELYLKSLAPAADSAGKPAESGAIAVHISNHFLDLEPVVRALQQRFSFHSLRFDTSDDPEHDVYDADWIILTHNANLASALEEDATPVDTSHPPVLWTDNRGSLFEVLK